MPKARQPVKQFRMSDQHRIKIQNSQILKCLIQHSEGTREMSQTQVTAGIALLKKVLPDLQTVKHEGSTENPLEITIRIGGDG